MKETVISELIGLVFSILMLLISSVLVPALSAWLKSKTQNEKVKAIITDISSTVETAVNMYEQTTVTKLKAAGEWDAKSQNQVLQDVIDEVVYNLMDSTLEAFTENRKDVSEVVKRYIESYIQSQKCAK